MIAYDVATKLLDTESFSQHNFAGLISGITFIVLLSQEKPLRWKEIHTHTHTRARTHTHMIKKYQSIHASENAYFWLHLLQKSKTCKCEDILQKQSPEVFCNKRCF